MTHRCPICKKIVEVPAQGQSEQVRFFPFCSRRCKLIDLGAWLDAKYKVISGLKSEGATEPSNTPSDTPAGKQ